MSQNLSDFNVGVIKPTECLKSGWALIKDQYWLFLGIALVGTLIGGAIPIVLLGPMMIGIYLCLFQKMRNETVEFGTLFKGFDYFVQGLIAAAIQMIPMFAIIVPMYVVFFAVIMTTMPRGHVGPDESTSFMFKFLGLEAVFIAVIVTVGLVVHIFFMFAFPLIADRKLSGLDAIKLSIKAGKANFGGILGLLLLNAGLGLVGFLCCIVGVYFVMPVSLASYAVAYRRIFPDIPLSFASPPPPPSSWAA